MLLLKTGSFYQVTEKNSDDAFSRLNFLREEEYNPLISIDGDHYNLYSWRANTDSSTEKFEGQFSIIASTKINLEMENASDLGLRVSYLYNAFESSQSSYSKSLESGLIDETIDSNASVEDLDSYLLDTNSKRIDSNLVAELYYWKEIMELGGGPFSFYSILGYKNKMVNAYTDNEQEDISKEYDKASKLKNDMYYAFDLFAPALHSLSLGFSFRTDWDDLSSVDFYQRSFASYKFWNSILRFNYQSGKRGIF